MIVGFWVIRKEKPDKLITWGKSAEEKEYSEILRAFSKVFPHIAPGRVVLTLDQTEEHYIKVLARQGKEE